MDGGRCVRVCRNTVRGGDGSFSVMAVVHMSDRNCAYSSLECESFSSSSSIASSSFTSGGAFEGTFEGTGREKGVGVPSREKDDSLLIDMYKPPMGIPLGTR